MRSDMEQMVKKYSIMTTFNKKDLAEIERKLREDEHVLFMYTAALQEHEQKTLAKSSTNVMKGKTCGVLAVTDQRALFSAHILFTHMYKEINRQDITDCTSSISDLMTAVTIYTDEVVWAIDLTARPVNMSKDIMDIMSYYTYQRNDATETEDI